MKVSAVCAAVLAMVAGSAWAQGSSAKIQCWTDKSGARMCGDNVPPEYAGTKREVMKGGRVVDTVKGAKTPEEVAEEKRQKEAAEQAEKRANYDRQLLETYRSSKDIESMRDERLSLIETRIQANKKNAEDNDRSLEGLRARVAALQKDNKPVDDRLAKQVKQFERAQKMNNQALARNTAEHDDVQTRFGRDLARFNELRAASKATKPAPAPAPGKP